MLKIAEIKPKSDCRACYGSGEVVDWVPYGDTDVPMITGCECVAEQVSQLEELVKEANDLVDKLEQITYKDAPSAEEDQRIDRIYGAAIARSWRRSGALRSYQ